MRVLGIHDVEEKKKFFSTVVDTIAKSSLLPEIERDSVRTRVQALLEYSAFANVYIAETPTSVAFSIGYTEDCNPHVDGKVFLLPVTLAYGSPSCTPMLLRSLITLARNLNCRFITVSHRTAPYTYKCKYIKIGD